MYFASRCMLNYRHDSHSTSDFAPYLWFFYNITTFSCLFGPNMVNVIYEYAAMGCDTEWNDWP